MLYSLEGLKININQTKCFFDKRGDSKYACNKYHQRSGELPNKISLPRKENVGIRESPHHTSISSPKKKGKCDIFYQKNEWAGREVGGNELKLSPHP